MFGEGVYRIFVGEGQGEDRLVLGQQGGCLGEEDGREFCVGFRLEGLVLVEIRWKSED